jgi:hypothetical protein
MAVLKRFLTTVTKLVNEDKTLYLNINSSLFKAFIGSINFYSATYPEIPVNRNNSDITGNAITVYLVPLYFSQTSCQKIK